MKDRRKAQLLGYSELAEVLGVSVMTLKRLVKKEAIPYHTMGKRVVFDLQEVLKATKKGKI